MRAAFEAPRSPMAVNAAIHCQQALPLHDPRCESTPLARGGEV
ncbi:MAG TPA: hypothetical protein PK797_01825 [Burkholderiaceae bacterium]|jgi:hypothetical protein|nr:hypothetical protein [Burkholderiaceae bacterium]